jgi:hypothetical protein
MLFCFQTRSHALRCETKASAIKDSLLVHERRAMVALSEATPTTTIKSPVFLSIKGWVILVVIITVITPFVVIVVSKRKKNAKAPQLELEREQLNSLQSIEVVNGGGLKLIPLDELIFIVKEDKSYFATAGNQKYRIGQNITSIENRLPKHYFRINRQVIINTRYMNNYSFWENHKYILRMRDENKTEFIIARSRLRELKKAFGVLKSDAGFS